MSVYTLQELVDYARENSPFYKKYYTGVPKKISDISDIPVMDQDLFWSRGRGFDSDVLTQREPCGIIFKSGGTTGQPRFSIFTDDEWQTFCRAFGWGMSHGAVKSGDRVANIFYAGDLYASFLFIMRSMELSGLNLLQVPLGKSVGTAQIVSSVDEFSVNVIAGVPTTVIQIADNILRNGKTLENVDRIIFGGEPMYPDQRLIVSKAFPNALIRSIGCASVDGGLIGYADDLCGFDEHIPFARETIMEIVDVETGKPIEETDRTGRLLITNLTRKLMPIIRYPSGDMALWSQYQKDGPRKFILQGRSEEGARIAGATVYYDNVRHILSRMSDILSLSAFQLLLSHHGKKDQLTVQIACELKKSQDGVKKILTDEFYQERPMLKDLIGAGMIHPLNFSFIPADRIEVNPRTGKIKRVIDLRSQVN
ncbi:MAG: phenylacetate--CoA ligase family protein [Oligoflexales bacterium]|nr:phenylacetate--CoA ligase family protein [Oligoflexales bacterium]